MAARQGMQMTLPFTIAVYMVRNFEGGIGEERVSRLTGLLAAVYSSSQFLTALAWGYLSDRIGRRPVVIIGNVGALLLLTGLVIHARVVHNATYMQVCTAAIVGFGASQNYAQAMFARFCGGFFNGITGALKTIVGESFDGDGQARALSALSCAWGLGTVFGSLLGGSLADPCREFGGGFALCAPGQLLDRCPYLLPCAAVGALSCFATVISLTVLKETLPKGGAAKYSKLMTDEEGSAESDAEPSSQRVAVHVQEPANTELVPVSWTHKSSDLACDGSASASGSPPIAAAQQPRETAGEHAADPAPPALSRAASQESLLTYAVDIAAEAADTSIQKHQQHEQLPQQQAFSPLPGASWPQQQPEAEAEDGTTPLQASGQRWRQQTWYRCREVQLTVLGYGSIALVNTFTNELVPLFASAPRDRGGLALRPSQLAGPLGFSGVVFLLYAAFGYPIFQRAIGLLATCLWGVGLSIPATMAVPLASLPAATSHAASQAVFYLSLAARQAASMNAFTSSIVLVNKAAPVGQLGAVNGAGQMLASAVRGAGPALCGVLWAAALGLRLPGHQFLPFAIVSAGWVGIFLHYWLQRDKVRRVIGRK